jgi:hypothetical protein
LFISELTNSYLEDAMPTRLPFSLDDNPQQLSLPLLNKIQHLFASEVIALPENPCKELVCKPISPYKNSGPYGEE